MAVLWYGLIPMIGGLFERYRWYIFRRRFDELCLRPMLDYNLYRQQQEEGRSEGNMPSAFRFFGGVESVTDRHTLWVRSDNLTIPVSLKDAATFLLPMQKKEGSIELFDPDEDAPEKIRWERVSALTEGAKVFIGGLLTCNNGRCSFVSTKNHPLMVIFFDGDDRHLAATVNRAGRHRSDYWNFITPFSLILGALSQILIAVLFIPRPAFRLTVIVSFVALFIPLYPIIPPGLLFTMIFRRLTWKSRMLRINSSNAGHSSATAYLLEILAWLILLTGIGLNILIINLVLALL